MAKEAYYFSHDYDPLGDPKMQAMVSEFGGLGYGIFWRLAEMLHADASHELPLKKYVFVSLGAQMKTEASFIENFINACISEFELFDSDGASFWSHRVVRNIEDKGVKKEKKVKSGQLGGVKSGESRNKKKEEPASAPIEAPLPEIEAPLQQNEAPLEAKEKIEAKESKVKESKEESLQVTAATAIREPVEIGSEAVVAAAKAAWEDQRWREQICMANYFDTDQLKQWMYMYNASLTADTFPDFSVSKYKRMFNGWLQAKKKQGYTLPEKKNTASGLRTLTE